METGKRILLVELYSNGDCLYATAVACQIKQDFPGCHLTWAIADFCKGIIENNPYVNEVRVVHEILKNDVVAFRKFRKKIFKEKKKGKWDEVFITHNMDKNQALYDGTIRGMIFRAYPNPITVPIQPTLILSQEEKQIVKNFAEERKLSQFKNIILWEFAPQSGQSVLNFDLVMSVSKKITEISDTCIILSSAQNFEESNTVFNASKLSVRQNAELTHYCTLMIGCSSGITWINTSTAGKQLPMLQLLNPQAFFINTPSTDFKRYGLSTDGLIEMTHFNEKKIFECIKMIFENGFPEAKIKFNEELSLQFNTTRKIVYNLLCYLQFGSIIRHCKIIKSVYGFKFEFLKQLFLGFITFPFKLIVNFWRKKIVSKF